MTMRSFEDTEARRTSVPLLVGLTGPSGGGKTYSALRLATGIQRVTGGDIYVIDTEARRALHYADQFRFRHVVFGAPFGPLDYLAAIEHCVRRGAKVVIVDSMSHEHEGPGGVLEQHASEMTRLAKLWRCSEDAANMSAWAAPKGARRRMINTILQLPISMLFCFRAKEKLKILPSKKPQQMGFCPIAGEEFTYEMTANVLLMPRADGVPTWQSDEIGERLTMKLPRQFAKLFAKQQPLSEDIGETMAKWAAGMKSADDFASDIERAKDHIELKLVTEGIAEARKRGIITKEERVQLASAWRHRSELLTAQAASATPEPPSQHESAPPDDGPERDPETGEIVPPAREPGMD